MNLITIEDSRKPIPANYTGCIRWTNSFLFEYFLDGKTHRDDDLPAMVYDNGTRLYFKNGLKHRSGDKPACIYSDGSRYWYVNGKTHRANGPAVITATGEKSYYFNGKLFLNKQDWYNIVRARKLTAFLVKEINENH